MGSAIKAVEPRQNAVRSALPRSVHVAEVVSLALVLESAPASHHLDAITEDHHSCAHRSIHCQSAIPFRTCGNRVYPRPSNPHSHHSNT